MSEWEPIKTAPEHDIFSPLLLTCICDGRKYVTVGFWDEDDGAWLDAMNHNGYVHDVLEPTHWMAFPQPPTKD